MNNNKLAAGISVAFTFAVAAPVIALASNGADDPADHLRNGRDDSTRSAALAQKSPATITLHGSVGPGYTISLTQNGQKIKSLRAGTYRFVIADHAAIHNFVLEKEHGGHFERELTDVSDVGTKTATLRLTRGTWKYYCEPHESVMFGSFTVR